MAKNAEYEFHMKIAGEKVFEVYRFGWDPNGFRSTYDIFSDSTNASIMGDSIRGLQTLCSLIESRKTMLFNKRSDLVTVRLVEAYLKKQTLDEIFFTVKEEFNGRRTPGFVASLFMKKVSIENLIARQQYGLPFDFPVDWVTLRADEVYAKPW